MLYFTLTFHFWALANLALASSPPKHKRSPRTGHALLTTTPNQNSITSQGPERIFNATAAQADLARVRNKFMPKRFKLGRLRRHGKRHRSRHEHSWDDYWYRPQAQPAPKRPAPGVQTTTTTTATKTTATTTTTTTTTNPPKATPTPGLNKSSGKVALTDVGDNSMLPESL